MLNWLKLRIILYFTGIRFYRTDTIPKSSGFMNRAEFTSDTGFGIKFTFYKEECVDLIYKRGKIREERFIGYTVHAEFDEGLSKEIIFKYNNLKFFFRAHKWFKADEVAISRMLLNLFLDRIYSEAFEEKES